MKTINGRRLFNLMGNSVALVVDVDGDGVIASRLNFMTTEADLTVTAVGYVNDKLWEFQFDLSPEDDIPINEVGQVLITQPDGTHAVSLLNWVDVTPDQLPSLEDIPAPVSVALKRIGQTEDHYNKHPQQGDELGNPMGPNR